MKKLFKYLIILITYFWQFILLMMAFYAFSKNFILGITLIFALAITIPYVHTKYKIVLKILKSL